MTADEYYELRGPAEAPEGRDVFILQQELKGQFSSK